MGPLVSEVHFIPEIKELSKDAWKSQSSNTTLESVDFEFFTV